VRYTAYQPMTAQKLRAVAVVSARQLLRLAPGVLLILILLVAFGCQDEARIAEARASEARSRAAAARAHRDVLIAVVITVGAMGTLFLMYQLYLRSGSVPDNSTTIATRDSSSRRTAPRYFFESLVTMIVTWLLIPSCLLAPLVVAISEAIYNYDPYVRPRNGILAGLVLSALIVLLRRTSLPPPRKNRRRPVLASVIGLVAGVCVGLALQNLKIVGPGAALKTLVTIVSLDWYFSSEPRKVTVTAAFLAFIAGGALPYLL